MIATLITLPYKFARLPLTLADGALADRLPETSVPRVALDRTIGSADRLAGTLLFNRELTERGADRLERSRTLLTAAELEAQAAATRKQAEKAAEAQKTAAQRQAKTELDQAREAKQTAAQARADAKRLNELTEAKQDQRKRS